MEPNPNFPTTHPTVTQHVTKASSDQLLRKFADSEDDNEHSPPSSARRSRSIRGGRSRTSLNKKRKVIMTITNNKNYNEDDEEQVQSLRTVERNSLLPQYYIRNPCSNSNSASAFLRKHLPITRSHHRHRKSARHFRTNSTFLSALDKTWTKAVRGATKIFMERHYSRHRILIDDIV
ncbi:unnamed protein product [Amaranthus hypochondriacus]